MYFIITELIVKHRTKTFARKQRRNIDDIVFDEFPHTAPKHNL
jgi:hypothetical protein